MFTTRPEIAGTFGAVTSTHWIASAVGMSVLERGGNAADAAVSAGFVLTVVEPHLNGPLGEVPILVWPGAAEAPEVICGQGVAPAGLTRERLAAEGFDHVPGAGLLAAVVPGAFDAWMALLEAHGTWPLADVLAPAIHYAEAGHPVLPRVSATIAGRAAFFRDHWPSSAEVWVETPPGALLKNPDLAATWRRLVAEAEAA
ncbi:MAG: gamma-glutamyltransferase, partial [Pseudomonadota bacterium]